MIPLPHSLRQLPDAPGAFAFELEADHPAFTGHFPGQPVLPGVVQVDWAIRLGGKVFGPLGAFRALEHLKFQATLEPLETVELRLTWEVGSRQLGFAYTGPQGRKSSGFAQFIPES